MELVNLDLIALDFAANCSCDLCTCDIRCAEDCLVTIDDSENLLCFVSRTLFEREQVDLQCFAFNGLVLLAENFYECVHI